MEYFILDNFHVLDSLLASYFTENLLAALVNAAHFEEFRLIAVLEFIDKKIFECSILLSEYNQIQIRSFQEILDQMQQKDELRLKNLKIAVLKQQIHEAFKAIKVHLRL